MSEQTKSTPVPGHAGKPERTFEFVEPEDGIFRTYSNHHRFGWTGYDVRLLFGELIDVRPDKYIVEETAHITMSWMQAKNLLASLQNLIQKYETDNGPLEPVMVPVL
jgi:hypothetical protein